MLVLKIVHNIFLDEIHDEILIEGLLDLLIKLETEHINSICEDISSLIGIATITNTFIGKINICVKVLFYLFQIGSKYNIIFHSFLL